MILDFKKVIVVTLLTMISGLGLHAQYTVQVQVESMPTSKAYVYEFLGDRPSNMLDSIRTRTPGLIRFSLPADAHPGMYRLVLGPQTWLDFVFNRENINLRTDFNSPVDSLKVISSLENTLWAEYMHFYMLLNRKQDYLSRLLSMYQPSDPFYTEIEKELTSIRLIDPESASKKIISENPQSYVARFLKVELSPTVPVGLDYNEERDYILDNFFEHVDFDDPELIYSPPLMAKINSFFGIYQQAFPPTEVEEAMIGGVNRLLSLAAINDDVYNFIVTELSTIFERSEYETFFAYFTENFLLDASCTDEDKNLELAEILAAIKKTEIGIVAPEIMIPLADGQLVLSEMNNEATLVLFWASWCPHCNEMLPQLKGLYNTYKSRGFEIIAISIDKEKSEYNKALAQGNYPWINYSEFKGWDCSIAYDYGIRATPTMILVDKDGKIAAKPRDPKMLESLLSEIF